MPQTKKQEIVYTVMMVCVMVYGMVCYNIALDVGGMQNFIFAAALSELPIMGVIFRHAALQGQPQRELFRYVGADHGDELSHGIFVAAVRRGPAGAVRVWQGSGRYEKEVITIS